MKSCPACKTRIGDGFAKCPICGLGQENVNPADAFYPKCKTRKTLFFWRKLLVYLLWLGTAVTVFINCLLGGVPWSVYVVLSAFLVQVLFLSWETAEISLIRRIVLGSFAISILLQWIEYATKSGTWAREIVIPLVLFAAFCASAVLYFSAFRRFKAQFLPMLGIAVFSFVAISLAMAGVLPMGWPLILLSAFSFVTTLAILFTFRKQFWAEWKKKLHR